MLIVAATGFAQRGDIIIPTGAEIALPPGTKLCADRYYANNPGYGVLNFGQDATRICGAVIPVAFVSLSAYHLNGKVTVQWRTATEDNCAGYIVQRSLDQALWQTAGYIPGHGTTMQEYAYTYLDELPPSLEIETSLFYRLRQIDYDGTIAYSPVVAVNIDGAPPTVALQAAYPNPTSNSISVHYTLPDASSARISVYALSGQEVLSFVDGDLAGTGEHFLSVNTSSLAPGGYLIVLFSGDTQLSQRFVVRR